MLEESDEDSCRHATPGGDAIRVTALQPVLPRLTGIPGGRQSLAWYNRHENGGRWAGPPDGHLASIHRPLMCGVAGVISS